MKDNKWMLPTKVKGIESINVTYYIEPELAIAFKEFSDRQSQISGVKVSVGTILKTAMLQRYPEIRWRYQQLKRENAYDRKYMDIKKPKQAPDAGTL
jgi:hypothetical protein